jgi:hypothetical protein
MAIARFENITVQNVTTSIDSYGQQTYNISTAFQTRAKVEDFKAGMQITKDDRVYSDLVKFILNYTPNTLNMVNNQNGYAIYYRSAEWRIHDCMEANDRMTITFMCYRNKPTTPV